MVKKPSTFIDPLTKEMKHKPGSACSTIHTVSYCSLWMPTSIPVHTGKTKASNIVMVDAFLEM
jgi:hypothetical protein